MLALKLKPNAVRFGQNYMFYLFGVFSYPIYYFIYLNAHIRSYFSILKFTGLAAVGSFQIIPAYFVDAAAAAGWLYQQHMAKQIQLEYKKLGKMLLTSMKAPIPNLVY